MINHQAIVAKVIAQAGGQHALGRALGIKFQSIQSWRKIPPARVSAIETALGIPREQLRPDLYAARKPQR
jgi:DNA-binding transcriptional regulator YdaS (Cro superfamily)